MLVVPLPHVFSLRRRRDTDTEGRYYMVPVCASSLPSLLPAHRSRQVVHPGVSFHWPTGRLPPHPTAGGRSGRPVTILCPFLWAHSHGREHNKPFPAHIKPNLCMIFMVCFMSVYTLYVECVVMIHVLFLGSTLVA